MKKISILIFCLSFVFNLSFAQSPERKLSDYGISAEQAKNLTTQEIKDILSQPTQEEIVKGMEEAREKDIPYVYPEGYPVQMVEKKEIPNTVNCFDYYKFNSSVQTDISTISTITKAGDTILFTGTIRNENNYPIVSGELYVKVFKIRGEVKDPNGPDVVDEFTVLDSISIPAKSRIPVSFSWKVPEYSENGKYSLISFFIVDNKFNLLGLSFTDDVIGNFFEFKVTDGKENISFDKNMVEINNDKFYFAAFPPKISSGIPAVIKSVIINNTKKDETVTIKTKLYEWDAINPDNFIREYKEDIFIKANSTTTHEFIVSEDTAPVYYIVEELSYKDSKSFLNIRFVRPEVDKIRLNFPSIMEYPIKKNSTSTVFSCLHNSGVSSFVKDGKLILKILDKKEKVINEYIYTGVVTGDMMAVKNDFISKKDLKDFSIETQLWQGGELVDKSIMKYSCKDIDPENCGNDLILYVYIFVLLVLVISILLIKRKNKNVK